MKQLITSEKDMQDYARNFARQLKGGEIIELIGDVGAGKTTFVKGLAKGLGVKETVQSPSFTIFAKYNASGGRSLHHYDFYRLDEPGLVAHDLAESLEDKAAITVVEWAQTISHILPGDHITIHISTTNETVRELNIKGITT